MMWSPSRQLGKLPWNHRYNNEDISPFIQPVFIKSILKKNNFLRENDASGSLSDFMELKSKMTFFKNIEN